METVLSITVSGDDNSLVTDKAKIVNINMAHVTYAEHIEAGVSPAGAHPDKPITRVHFIGGDYCDLIGFDSRQYASLLQSWTNHRLQTAMQNEMMLEQARKKARSQELVIDPKALRQPGT